MEARTIKPRATSKEIRTAIRKTIKTTDRDKTRSNPPREPSEASPWVTHEFEVHASGEDERLDVFLVKRLSDYSRSLIQKQIKEGHVTVRGKHVKPSTRLENGDRVTIQIAPLTERHVVPSDIPLDILFEDKHLIVINKSPNFVVHPAAGHFDDTLANALMHHCGQLAVTDDASRPGIVHRLDKDTSGVILAAKTEQIHAEVSRQFQKRTVTKEYLALVEGEVTLDSDVIDKSIMRHKKDREKMAVVKKGMGKEATTRYQVMERFRGFTFVKAMPKTGRTHQIRVHLGAIGHPCVADSTYGYRDALYLRDLTGKDEAPGEPLIARQALHAHALTIRHPATGETMTFSAPLPEDMTRALEALRRFSSKT